MCFHRIILDKYQFKVHCWWFGLATLPSASITHCDRCVHFPLGTIFVRRVLLGQKGL